MVQQILYQSPELRQEQVIAPYQIQSLEMLTAPYLEMQALITHELEINPTLERLSSNGEQLVGDPIEDLGVPPKNDNDAAGLIAEKDEFIANIMQLDDSWRDYVPPDHSKTFSTRDDEDKRQYFFDSLATRQTLSDYLMEQLRTNNCSLRMKEIGEAIIGCISDSGYLRNELTDLAPLCNATIEEMNTALNLIQSFDPPGVGARNLKECLLLQLERKGEKGTLAYKVINKYLDKLAKNRIPEIAKALKVSPAVLQDVNYEIKQLNPKPGHVIESTNEHYILPELFIEKDGNNQLVVSTNKDNTPALRISARYLKIMEDPNTPVEVRNYIKQKVSSGNLLMKSISQRQSTILSITEKIVEHQKDFFIKGEEAMKPLIMAKIASEVGVHETTVSRAIANKYVQTPRGIFPLKHFFTSGFQTDNGNSVSSHSIMNKIKETVSKEDPAHPVSDQKIVKLLAEQGINVARRTVAKYRESLGIASSHIRKNHSY